MMDLLTIHELSAGAALNARRNNLVPLMLAAGETDAEHIRNIPDLGTYVPRGWKRVRLEDWFGPHSPHGVYYGDANHHGAFFVDSSGFASPGEPALSLDELVAHLRPGYGYAIVESGQFQVKIGVFTAPHHGS